MKKAPRINLLRRLTLSTAFALAALCSTAALAGEVKIGTAPIELDDKGKVKNKDVIVDTVDEIPGEDVWKVFVYARLDNPAPGPLYIEFYQDVDGNKSLVWRHDEPDFQGDKYIIAEVELEGRKGFNKNRTYDIKVTQVSPKGKDLTLATGKIKLIKSGKKPEPSKDEGGEGGEEPKTDPDQDAIDTLVGGDGKDAAGDGGSDPAKEGPPAVEKKKGCAIDSEGTAWNGALVLMALGAGFVLRRRK